MEGGTKKKLTPVMRQYQDAKDAYPDAILFFRMGDFYEMFHDDAVVASKALSLTLTARNKGDPDEIPMAGVPHHAAHGYVAKLLGQGFKVAICDQMADPSKVKGIVPREVVRVLTPGLITDGDQLDARANHWLAAVDGDEMSSVLGLALLDLSTGELSAGAIEGGAALVAELARADAREVLFAAELASLRASAAIAAPRAALREDDALPNADVPSAIDDAVPEPLSRTALEDLPLLAVRAVARVLRYARRCTPSALIPVRRVARYESSASLAIDETAQVHLELVRAADGGKKGSLLDVVDGTVTPAGARLLRRRLLAPLVDLAAIRRRLDQIELFVVNPRARGEARVALGDVGDLERLTVRALLREATPRDLGGIRDGLRAAPAAAAAVASIPDPAAPELLGVIDPLPELSALLARALIDRPPPHGRDGGYLREGYDTELDEQRAIKHKGTEIVVALEAELRQQTGIATLRVRYTRVFGWYIEVTRAQSAKVPTTWRRKQTVAGAERYTNEELDDVADRIEHAEARAHERESKLFEELVAAVVAEAERLRSLARTLAEWDVAAGLADVAHRFDYARPEVDAGDLIAIEEGRHPVVEQIAAAGRFVPNDVTLDLDGERLWLITGPNMAGKSTLMRQVALTVILAQMGSYVPAAKATIGVVDRILSRVGASDNVARGESTFMVEMRETAAILRGATRRSLVVLDEIGRGTSTYDGLAIAWAVAEHLHDIVGCRALFATHYHELTDLARTATGVANHSVAAREHGDDIVFLHRLTRGPASRSYGVAVARLAGVPESVVARAKALLASLEGGAPLPSGGHATLRARSRAGVAQLDLFAPAKGAAETGPVVDTLRAVEVERLTPLDALQLVAKLKTLLPPS